MALSYLEKEDENEIITQDAMLKEVDIGSATKRFDVKLQYGPYAIDYSRNGSFFLRSLSLTNARMFLHQETFVAVAEKRYVSIYDNQGLEVHCLKKLSGILRMEFLPYHFLLVSSADNGFLYYLDCSIGTIVTSIPTYMGRLGVMCQNPSNGVICTGHNDGVVSMWVPSEKSYVIKMFAHPTAITSIACDQTGRLKQLSLSKCSHIVTCIQLLPGTSN
ncbi:unnamed protein product [Schistosoma curassoni]|uniref:WD_REPEATS_REGION domain-containing protein n=1 Tax=Schistosoma curassoni TaxID=6186 RepID=A0A183JJW9_9TREM|nr:unnamed protein product [Schistosoma curassoni]